MDNIATLGDIIVLNKYPRHKYLVIRGEHGGYSLLNLDGYYLAYNNIPDDYKIVGEM